MLEWGRSLHSQTCVQNASRTIVNAISVVLRVHGRGGDEQVLLLVVAQHAIEAKASSLVVAEEERVAEQSKLQAAGESRVSRQSGAATA